MGLVMFNHCLYTADQIYIFSTPEYIAYLVGLIL